MAALTIRNIDDETKQALRMSAARRGVSMEQEARSILRAALHGKSGDQVAQGEPKSWYESLRRLVDQEGGFELELPPREPMRDPPTFE